MTSFLEESGHARDADGGRFPLALLPFSNKQGIFSCPPRVAGRSWDFSVKSNRGVFFISFFFSPEAKSHVESNDGFRVRDSEYKETERKLSNRSV